MAETKKAEASEAPKKHFLTITDKDGKYAPTPLAECNAHAQGALMGRKRREKAVLSQISTVIKTAMKRA